MSKVAGGIGLLFAVVAGYFLYGWIAGTAHSETGALGVYLDDAWLIFLIFFGFFVVIGSVAFLGKVIDR